MSSRINCILLVDDDEPTNMFHRIVLENTGVSKVIKVAETGFQALRLLQDPQDITCQDPDIIFLDLNMPIMDGFQFIDAFKKLDFPKKENILIVILTSSMNPQDIQQAKSLGIDHYMAKPINEEKIMTLLKDFN